MAYDPDLDPILAAIHARLDALEGREPAPPAAPEPEPALPVWDMVSQSRLTIPDQIEVPAGQGEIYIPVTADHTNRESFFCYISRLINVSGGGINVGNEGSQRKWHKGFDAVYRWSPGDDLTHYIHVSGPARNAGQSIKVDIRVKGLGDRQKGSSVLVRFVDGAQHPDMPEQFHRPLRKLTLDGASRANSFDPASVTWGPEGVDDNGRPSWKSRLAHGRAQPGNGETGIYSDETIAGSQKPISYDAAEDAIRLHTVAFEDADRIEYDSRLWRHQAAVIQGQTLDDVCGVDGVWRMVAKSSIRRYAWPAFWLVGRGYVGEPSKWGYWPPEIDIFEHFNSAWGAGSTPYTTTFAQHYGNAGANERKGAFGSEIEVDQWMGASGIAEDYHSYACAVVYDESDPLKSEVTFFFDDVEIGCQVLHARHQDLARRLEFYPITNVAVRAPDGYSAAQYNGDPNPGDMLIRDIAYYPSGFAFG